VIEFGDWRFVCKIGKKEGFCLEMNEDGYLMWGQHTK